MILKNFLGKTIEVAKKSAPQMHGDDVVVLDSSDSDRSVNADITVAADKQMSELHARKNRSGQGQTENRKPDNGVSFERTLDRDSEKKSDSTLNALRRYAEKNEPANGKNVGISTYGKNRDNTEEKKYSEKTALRPSVNRQNSTIGNPSLYSGANVRPLVPEKENKTSKENNNVTPANGTGDATINELCFITENVAGLRKYRHKQHLNQQFITKDKISC